LASFLFRLGELEKAGKLYLECLAVAPDALSLHQKIWRLLLYKPLDTGVMERYAALMKDVLPIRNPYYCTSCGITSSQYQWQCPGCHQFGSYKERTL
jgi:lipopolysaccharide biosynthesis regulator YciM